MDLSMGAVELLNKIRATSEYEVAGNTEASDRRWVLAIDPVTLDATIVRQESDGSVSEVKGKEDLFPLSMVLDNDGYLEGGDWLVAKTPCTEEHDGMYRSYWVDWIEDE